MKFSDMMGKRDRGTTEVTDPQPPAEAATAPPVPEAPVRFTGARSELDEAAAALGNGAVTREATVVPPVAETVAFTPAPRPAVEPLGPPSISDVVAELAPRPATAGAPLDTGTWLDGIDTIDDDLLPH